MSPAAYKKPPKEVSALQRARKRAGLTLQELGDRAGTTATQISRLEKGIRRMTWDWAQRLADALQCDPALLMFGGEDPKVPIIGRVDSTGAVAPIANDGQHQAVCPRGMNPQSTAALLMDGDAGAALPRGWFLFLDQKAGAPERGLGLFCMVKLRGEPAQMLRIVRKAPTPGRFNLTSAGGQLTEDAEVEAVAPIRAIVAADLAIAA